MRWPEPPAPAPMSRVALVAPVAAVRPVLVGVAGAGTVQLDRPAPEAPPGEAARRLQRLGAAADRTPRVAAVRPDLDLLAAEGRGDLLAGEAELEEREAGAVRRGAVSAVAGWIPQADLPDLAARLVGVGGAVVQLPSPPGVDPPTLVRHSGAARSFEPLVGTYATVPYRDVDPTIAAGVAYVVMFGMMFGDAGHGLLLLLGGLALRAGWPRRFGRLRQHWQLVVGAGVAATLFGLAYGEFFGPTGVVPALWLDPLDEPTTLLAAAVGLGALLLAGAYGVGIVNRLREGGWSQALYASGGIAGATLFLGAGLVVAGWYAGRGWLAVAGGTVTIIGLILAFIGLYAGSGGGGAGTGQAVVELVDTVTRLGGNVVSFSRLAAFGITHAAIAGLVWTGAVALWGKGPIGAAGAVVLFAVGTALAFGLEALVAAIQALRLEYYELFSRVFATEGRPFHPWRLPVVPAEEVPR